MGNEGIANVFVALIIFCVFFGVISLCVLNEKNVAKRNTKAEGRKK